MANVKISELTPIASVDPTDLLEVSEDTGSGTYSSKKATATQFKDFLLGTTYVSFTGPTADRVYTLPDASATVLTSAAAVTAAQGGTGQTSYTAGDLLYASGTTALSTLAGVATGNALISGGVGTAPSWGKVGLATHVSGTLPVANGGTGATTLTGVVKGNGTSAFTAGTVSVETEITGTLPIANGGTGQTTATAGFDALAPTTTRGDLIVRGASSNTRLAVGTSSQVLHGGTDPNYAQVNLTTTVTGILPAANGGTGNGFTAFTGPTTSTKTFTLPNASATILTSNTAVLLSQGGTGATDAAGARTNLGTVAKAGDTFTGDIAVAKTTPVVTVNDTSSANTAVVDFKRNGVLRWAVSANTSQLTNPALSFISYNSSGSLLGTALTIQNDTRVCNFEQIPVGPASNPTTDNQFARKAYVDANSVWVKIADQAITNVSQVDVTWTNGAYRAIQVRIMSWLPTSLGSGFLIMQVRAGGSFVTAAGTYVGDYITVQGSSVGAGTFDTTSFSLTDQAHNAAADYASTLIEIDPGPGATAGEATAMIQTRWSGPSGRRVYQAWGVAQVTTNTVDGIRLTMSGTTFQAVGRLVVTGIRA